ncbi:hypothetical protein DMA11_01360 [Marinilabiliaceae bacterium JC017]|nr:hypothetical protein DMA11_01360 [Marinilabiliaceae bacterium JC017]
MRRHSLISLLVILINLSFLFSCATKKKISKKDLLPKPAWLVERPVNHGYFYGIGAAKKVGGHDYYKDKSKERALAEIAAQINTQIQSTSTLYQMEDNHGVTEYLQNRIKATSNEFLEGYEFINTYEDEDNYYSFFRLSKSVFYERKEQRKNDALSTATTKYITAKEFDAGDNTSKALIYYAEVLEVLTPYLGQNTLVKLEDRSVDLVSESKNAISRIVKNITLSSFTHNFSAQPSENIPEGAVMLTVQNKAGVALENIPVRFAYSNGYLVVDKQLSNASGEIKTPAFTTSAGSNESTLTGSIDILSLSRKTTKNLFVRKLIEKEKGEKIVIKVTIDR